MYERMKKIVRGDEKNMNAKRGMKKIFISCLVMVGMSVNSYAGGVFFKNTDSGLKEVERLVSGDIYVYPIKSVLEGATASLKSNTDGRVLPCKVEYGSSMIFYKAENVFDGDDTTAATVSAEWIWNLEIDLGQEKEISNFKVGFLEDQYPINYCIETSLDGSEWTMAAEDTENTCGGKHSFDFESRTARYIRVFDRVSQKQEKRRMAITSVESSNGRLAEQGGVLAAGLYNRKTNRMCAFETKVIEPSTSTEDIFLMLNVPEEITGLPEEIPVQENLAKGATGRLLGSAGNELPSSSGREAFYALDGDMETSACAAVEWAWTFEAELTEEKEFEQVVIYMPEGEFPIDFDILVSADGEQWEIVKQIKGNSTGGMFKLNFDSVSARYIRVHDNLAQTNVRQMAISEFEVYEKSYETDYEVRAFAITNFEEYEPLENSVNILK